MTLLRNLLALAFCTLVGAAAYGAWYVNAPLRFAAPAVEVEIPPGIGFRAAVGRLERAGVGLGPRRFEILARLRGQDQEIKAGYYGLAAPMTPPQLLDKLARGEIQRVEVQVLEGWTFRELRAALDGSVQLRHDTAGMAGAELLKRIGATEAHPEGLFFPDTYVVARGSSDLALLRHAYRMMQQHLAREWPRRAPDTPYRSPYEALVMASIIEKETGRAEERERIAAVLVNRLRIRMALQADPTVIYGLGEGFDGDLKKAQLRADSPYNTYTRRGLPPSPIALPGLASLRAALQPAQSDALYYVSRGDGTSQFSRTLREHNRAVTKYQLKPRRQ